MSKTSAVSFKVESNVAIPQRAPRGVFSKLLTEMKNGDSIVVPAIGKVLGARAAAKKVGCSLVTRKLDNGSFRIWKTAKAK